SGVGIAQMDKVVSFLWPGRKRTRNTSRSGIRWRRGLTNNILCRREVCVDFYQIQTKESKSGYELFPDFLVGRSQDLMIQGRTFYAVWDEERGMWSQDEFDVQRLVDEDLQREADRIFDETGSRCAV